MRTTLASISRGVLALAVLLSVLAVTGAAAARTSAVPPGISGIPEVGNVLTVVAPPGPAGAPVAYEWQRCGGVPYADEVLRDAPAIYYRLGDPPDATAVTDATGGESAGVLRPGVLLEADGGPFEDGDGAVELDGVEGAVEVPAGPALDLGDSFALELWIRPSQGFGTLLDQGPDGYALRLEDGRLVLDRNGGGRVAEAAETVPLDSAFHHVVASKEGTSIALYLDGDDVTGTVDAGSFSFAGGSLLVGASHDGEPSFAGGLDEVALYRAALPAERVRAHHDAATGCRAIEGAEGTQYRLAAPDYGATVRVIALSTGDGPADALPSDETPVIGTSMPVALEPPVVWGEAVVGRELVAGEGVWAGAEPIGFSYHWQSCLDGRYAAAVLADRPSGYWRLGELSGTAARDGSGNANKGSYGNGVSLGIPGALAGSGDANAAAGFDGRNDHVSVPDKASLDLGDSLTLEQWVRHPGSGTKGQIVQKGVGGYALRIDPDSRVRLARSNGGDVAASKVPVPADGAFHHVVATKNGSSVRIYLDGADVTEVLGSQKIVDTAAPLQIGRFRNQATGTVANPFKGDLDEVAVYDHVLSAARVRAHRAAGLSACFDIPGATGAAYTPTEGDRGKRLRVVVTATGQGSAVAVSPLTQAPVDGGGEPVVAAGTVTDAGGKPLPGARVSLHLWRDGDGADGLGSTAPADEIAEAFADTSGSYVLRSGVTPEIQDAADANGGVVNFEVRAEAGGLVSESFVERDFAAPEGESLAAGGGELAGASAVWQDSVRGLPAEPAPIVLSGEEDAVAEADGVTPDPPGTGVECTNWDIMFNLWKRTGQGEAYVRVGELHTWSAMTNRFEYGTRADSTIGIAFKTPRSKWFANGSVRIGRATGRSTAAAQSATTVPGQYTSRAVKARFVFKNWYQCGTGNRMSRADRWNGLNLAKGARVHSRDGECSELAFHVFDPEQEWGRSRHRATWWGAAANLGVLVVGARSGYSRWVKSEWRFGTTLASRTLCGVKKPPGTAARVFAGW